MTTKTSKFFRATYCYILSICLAAPNFAMANSGSSLRNSSGGDLVEKTKSRIAELGLNKKKSNVGDLLTKLKKEKNAKSYPFLELIHSKNQNAQLPDIEFKSTKGADGDDVITEPKQHK